MDHVSWSSLDGLPNELLAHIIQFLDSDSIRDLRLTCRALSQQCLVPRFTHCFQHIKLDLTDNSALAALSALVAPKSCSQLANLAQKMTLVTTIYDPTILQRIIARTPLPSPPVAPAVAGQRPSRAQNLAMRVAVAQSELQWLQRKQNEQHAKSDQAIIASLTAAFKGLKNLKNVELDAKLVQGSDSTNPTAKSHWHLTWPLVSRTYRLGLSAMAKSGVHVESFNVLRDTPHCSVALSEIAAGLQELKEVHNLGQGDNLRLHLRYCSLSISPAIDPKKGGPPSSARSKVPDRMITSITRLLVLMPSLEELDLHLYFSYQPSRSWFEEIFESLASTVKLPQLKRCTLRGIRTTTDSLLQFLTHHPQLVYLRLRNIRLWPTWQPIFECLSDRTKMHSLERLSLSTLRDCGMVLHVHPAWAAPLDNEILWNNEGTEPVAFRCDNGQYFLHARDFDVQDIAKGLQFETRPRCGDNPRGYQLWADLLKEEFKLP